MLEKLLPRTRKAWLAQLALGGMITAAQAGTIGWDAPAADFSGSLQAGASEFMPFAISAGFLAAGSYLPGIVGPAIGMGVGLYGAANSDEVAGAIGEGGGGGLITDTVYF